MTQKCQKQRKARLTGTQKLQPQNRNKKVKNKNFKHQKASEFNMCSNSAIPTNSAHQNSHRSQHRKDAHVQSQDRNVPLIIGRLYQALGFMSTSTTNQHTNDTIGMMSFYPDSVEIGIDTLSTYCLTNDMDDFTSKPIRCTGNVMGINSTSASISYNGTATYKVVDGNGMVHDWIIPEIYYCASTPYRVISPQHLDSCWHKRKMGRLNETTSSKGTLIKWLDANRRSFQLFIKHSNRSNVPILHTQPSTKNYEKYTKLIMYMIRKS